MAAKNSSPELSFGDWEDEDVDELLKQHQYGFDCCRQVSWRSVCQLWSAHARKSIVFNYLHFY